MYPSFNLHAVALLPLTEAVYRSKIAGLGNV